MVKKVETKEEMTNLEKAEAKTLSAIVALDKAFRDGEPAQTVNALAEYAKECANAYNKVSKAEVYNACIDTNDPIIAACRTYTYKTMSVKAETVDGDIIGYTDADGEKIIDLKDFIKRAELQSGKTLVADSHWVGQIERMNQAFTRSYAEVISDTAEREAFKAMCDKKFKLSRLAKEIAEGATPTSNTQLLKGLQTCVDMIVGYTETEIKSESGSEIKKESRIKMTSHDAAAIKSSFAKMNKRTLALTTGNTAEFTSFLFAAMHRFVTNKSYTVESKAFVKEEK